MEKLLQLFLSYEFYAGIGLLIFLFSTGFAIAPSSPMLCTVGMSLGIFFLFLSLSIHVLQSEYRNDAFVWIVIVLSFIFVMAFMRYYWYDFIDEYS